ncbi:phage tail tube protein [Planktotalea sp.]|uniref:phage tail tube protein n=1 Tax=Planktotalea sp. TaxID=2029877 RepID=UPI003D6BD972
MAKQNPDLMLLKMGDGADPVGYSTLCGLNSRNLSLDGENVDVTTIPCDGAGGKVWREFAAGVAQVSFSGNGYFAEKAQSVRLVEAKMTGTSIDDFQVIVPGLGTFEGKFAIGTLSIAGEVSGGAVTQSLELASTGEITFTAES